MFLGLFEKDMRQKRGMRRAKFTTHELTEWGGDGSIHSKGETASILVPEHSDVFFDLVRKRCHLTE